MMLVPLVAVGILAAAVVDARAPAAEEAMEEGQEEGKATTVRLRLPSILASHMVLQHSAPVTIWGWAPPQQRVWRAARRFLRCLLQSAWRCLLRDAAEGALKFSAAASSSSSMPLWPQLSGRPGSSSRDRCPCATRIPGQQPEALLRLLPQVPLVPQGWRAPLPPLSGRPGSSSQRRSTCASRIPGQQTLCSPVLVLQAVHR